MADDVAPGASFTAGADEIDGVKYQRIKLIHGQNNTNDGDVSSVNGLPVQVLNANPNGPATSANSISNVLAADQNVAAFGQGSGEYVGPSATAQALGGTGGLGDFLSHVTIVPHTLSPGAVSIKDGSGTARNIFEGGANSVSNLVPFTVVLGWTSTNGAWQLTTGADVHAFGFGRLA